MSMIWKQYIHIADEVINQACIVELSSTAHRLSRRSIALIVIQLKGHDNTSAATWRFTCIALRTNSRTSPT